MDSTLISTITEIIELANAADVVSIGNLLSGVQRSLAMQWFVGNSFFFAVTAAFSVIVYFMGKPPISAEEGKTANVSTKKFAVITGIFVLGLVLSQILLQLIGILAWCAVYGIVIAIYLKGKSSWFIRRSHSIPAGWCLMFFLLIVIMILAFNTLPTLSAMAVADAVNTGTGN